LVGKAGYAPAGLHSDLTPLFETIIKEVPAPDVDLEAPAKLLVTTLEWDTYKGQIGIGRLLSGKMRKGMPAVRLATTGDRIPGRIDYLFTFRNLIKDEVDEVLAGDILAFGGFDPLGISDTIADPSVTEALPPISVEEPTVRMTFGVNTSPLSGREGKTGWGTSRRLRQRLYDEIRSNVALRVTDGDSPDKFIVSGRGELHLGILIETMRREGFEFEVSKPEVIFRVDPETEEVLEPIEEVHIEITENLVGTVVEMLGGRRGTMTDMRSESGTTYIKYLVPTRGMLGFRANFMRATSGMGQIHSLQHGYDPLAGEVPGRQFGSLVASDQGVATPYSMVNVQARGTYFISPGAEVYEGMVVGEHIRPGDLDLNVVKEKQLNNFRAKPRETTSGLNTPRDMSLDDWIEFMAADELLEVTPQNLRLRKRILNQEDRLKDRKRREKQIENA
jgi:GTP-binding protein